MVVLNLKNIKIVSLENLFEFLRLSGKEKELEEILKRPNKNTIEGIILDYAKKKFQINNRFIFNREYTGFDSPDIIPKSEPNIEYVSQAFLDYIAENNSLEKKVLGAYDPQTNTIYILNTLYGRKHDEVLHHEMEHWRDPNASESEVRRRTELAGFS